MSGLGAARLGILAPLAPRRAGPAPVIHYAPGGTTIALDMLLLSLKPDFKTIADFRSDNRAAFKKVFRVFVILCRRLDPFGRELLAIDGTRIKAVNNKDRNFTTGSLQKFIEAADKKLEDYLNGSTRAMPRSARPAVRGARIWRKRSRR